MPSVENFKKYQDLARCTNSTFGDSATVRSPVMTQSIKVTLVNETMAKITFMMVVNFSSDNMMREMTERYRTEGRSMVEAALERFRKDYKELTDSVVKLKVIEESINDSFEFLSYSMYNPKKSAYYRLSCNVEID